jgi:general stress protein 26
VAHVLLLRAVREGKEFSMASRKIRELYDLVEGIETAMFTTRRRDGHLVSRPMATQKRSPGADFWFVTYKGAEKLDEIAHDPHVNLSYYKDRTREWISVSGIAETSTNRRKIRELYEPDWKAWFGDEGGSKDGGPDDPRMVLVKVKAREATFLDIKKPQPVVLFEVLKGMVTGQKPNLGRTRHAKASDFPAAGRRARTKGSKKARGARRPRRG